MRNTKLWSVLLASVLLCACVLGVLFTGASATGEVTYGVGYTEGIDEDKQFETFSAAFEAVEKAIEDGAWTEGNTLVIKFAGTHEAKVEESELLFGQKTIFTSTGKKLPITILGTEESDASTVKVTADKIACANDYTFQDLTLDLHSHVSGTSTFKEKEYNLLVNFFAGSGNVTMNNVAKFKAGSQVFADNYTAEAYEGWTEADVEALMDEDDCLLTSVTFTNTGFENGYAVNADASDLNDFVAGLAAVGATRDASTGEDAYAAVISENLTITPADTKAKVLVTAGTVDCRVGGYVAEYPARVHTAIIMQTGGSVNALAGDEAGGQIKNNIENGNIIIDAQNAPQTGTVRVLYGGDSHNDMTNTADAPAGEYGNVTVTCKNIKKGGSAFVDGSGNKTIPGKATITLEKFHHAGASSVGTQSTFEFIGIGALGGIENTLKQCRITGYSGARYTTQKTNSVGDVVNTLTDVVYTGNSSKYPFQALTFRNNSPKLKANSITNTLTNVQFGSSTNYIHFYGSRNVTVTGDITNNLTDCVFNHADAKYYGAYGGSAVNVKNTLTGCTLKAVCGVYNGNYTNVINNFDGTSTTGYNGTYSANVTGEIVADVKGASVFSTFYSAFGHSTYTLGDVKNTFHGGTVTGDLLLGGYGGKSVKSVTNTFNGGTFNNSAKMLCCGAGNNNWTSRVLGNVTNYFNDGTFSQVVYGGARGGCVEGDIFNYVKGGTFKSNFYGGNYAPAYYRSDYTYFNDFLNKGVVGTVYNYIGEQGKTEGGPTFEKSYFGGARGNTAAAARINRQDSDIENTVYYATFKASYFGGNGNDAYRTLQTGITAPEIQLNVTNTIYGGKFQSTYLGAGNGGAFVAGTGEIVAKVVGGLVKNEIYGGTFTGSFFGSFGANAAEMTFDTENHFYGGTLVATENYMGTGNDTKITGTITNTFEEGFKTTSAYVYGAGAGIANAPEGKPAVVNTVNGGSFDGFWGAGGKADLIVNGDVETTVNGGEFLTYDTNNLINGIAGGPRNGTLNGNATLIINGGTFEGQVCGGTFLGSADYKDRQINGSTSLTINGGIFKREIFACSSTDTVAATGGSTVKVVPTVGKELKIYADAEITELDASSEAVIQLGKAAFLNIQDLTGTLKVNQTEEWQPRIYAEIQSADKPITYTKDAEVTGEVQVVGVDSTILRGVGGAEIKAASLLLSDRIQIKLYFAKSEVEALGDGYEFIFKTRNGTVLGTANKDNLVAEENGDYSFVLRALGLSNFDRTVIGTGNGLYRDNFSVFSLAKLGADYYTETVPNATNRALFESIANLANVARGDELLYGEAPSFTEVTYEGWGTVIVDEEVLKMSTMSLIMTDAIGVRLTGSTVAVDTPIAIYSGAKDVTDLCVITRSKEAGTDGFFTFTADIYINVNSTTTELPFKICSGETELFSINIRVDALADRIVKADSENLLAKCALAYIQAADTYKKSVA